jgi:hypothetical protein
MQLFPVDSNSATTNYEKLLKFLFKETSLVNSFVNNDTPVKAGVYGNVDVGLIYDSGNAGQLSTGRLSLFAEKQTDNFLDSSNRVFSITDSDRYLPKTIIAGIVGDVTKKYNSNETLSIVNTSIYSGYFKNAPVFIKDGLEDDTGTYPKANVINETVTKVTELNDTVEELSSNGIDDKIFTIGNKKYLKEFIFKFNKTFTKDDYDNTYDIFDESVVFLITWTEIATAINEIYNTSYTKGIVDLGISYTGYSNNIQMLPYDSISYIGFDHDDHNATYEFTYSVSIIVGSQEYKLMTAPDPDYTSKGHFRIFMQKAKNDYCNNNPEKYQGFLCKFDYAETFYDDSQLTNGVTDITSIINDSISTEFTVKFYLKLHNILLK